MTVSPACVAATASDEASVDLPEPPFCVTKAMIFMASILAYVCACVYMQVW